MFKMLPKQWIQKIKHLLMSDGAEASNLNRFMKQKQNLIGCCVLVLLVVMVFVLHALSHQKAHHQTVKTPQKTTAVDGVLSSDFTQKNELSALEQQQQQMDRLHKELKTLQQSSNAQQKNAAENRAALLKELNRLLAAREARLKSNQGNLNNASDASNPHNENTQPTGNRNNQNNHRGFVSGKTAGSPFSRDAESRFTDADSNPLTHQLDSMHFHYEDPLAHMRVMRLSVTHHSAKTTKTYVPAGTFARGVLLEGADANASVNGQSDTVGILVRILDPGTLPNGHRSHLKGCFVLASIYGDISSERGEARLNTLSCTRGDGSILERKVQGYLSFAGKEGVKGTPVMRNGKILAMAGIAGLFSGIGSALQQSSQTQSISPLGVTSTVSPSKIWQNGAYGGASTAMSQLAHYYIQRADQYHPIIEVGSGTVATVIFQQGFSLVDDDDKKSAANAATQAVVNTSHPQELTRLLKEAEQDVRVKTDSPFSHAAE